MVMFQNRGWPVIFERHQQWAAHPGYEARHVRDLFPGATMRSNVLCLRPSIPYRP